jgi:hypothetical protein
MHLFLLNAYLQEYISKAYVPTGSMPWRGYRREYKVRGEVWGEVFESGTKNRKVNSHFMLRHFPEWSSSRA